LQSVAMVDLIIRDAEAPDAHAIAKIQVNASRVAYAGIFSTASSTMTVESRIPVWRNFIAVAAVSNGYWWPNNLPRSADTLILGPRETATKAHRLRRSFTPFTSRPSAGAMASVADCSSEARRCWAKRALLRAPYGFWRKTVTRDVSMNATAGDRMAQRGRLMDPSRRSDIERRDCCSRDYEVLAGVVREVRSGPDAYCRDT
jgi:hypothetical protein